MHGIIEKIKNETKKKIKAIERERDKEIERIIREARAKAKAIKKHSMEKAEKEAEMEEKRIISRANLKAKKARAKLIDSLFEEIISNTEKEIEKLRKEKNYQARLNTLVQRAIEEIPSRQVVVEISKEDARKLKLKKSKKRVRLKKSSQISIGAIVKSIDNSIRIDCTFPTILREKKQALKKELMAEIK